MDKKVCTITGANRGIGKTTALGLAKMWATVVMVCRNRKRGEAASYCREPSANGGLENGNDDMLVHGQADPWSDNSCRAIEIQRRWLGA